MYIFRKKEKTFSEKPIPLHGSLVETFVYKYIKIIKIIQANFEHVLPLISRMSEKCFQLSLLSYICIFRGKLNYMEIKQKHITKQTKTNKDMTM